jgi:hypothetical protein
MHSLGAKHRRVFPAPFSARYQRRFRASVGSIAHYQSITICSRSNSAFATPYPVIARPDPLCHRPNAWCRHRRAGCKAALPQQS